MDGVVRNEQEMSLEIADWAGGIGTTWDSGEDRGDGPVVRIHDTI